MEPSTRLRPAPQGAALSAAPPVGAAPICRIGPLTLDPGKDIVMRGATPLPLGQRAVALLRRLVLRPGEPVTKDELMLAGWGGRCVEESNLTTQISQLRQVLAREAGGSGWIETLPRRGYRFTGPALWQDATPSAPTAAISNIPIAVPLHFTGRAEALAALDAALEGGAHRPAIAALHGMRGIGKTILAATYARQQAASCRATWWLRAETVPTLRADLAALAVRLNWARRDAGEEAAVAAALTGLNEDGDRLLLVYDNAIGASALRPYLPKAGGARIVVTSNAHAWRAYATPLALPLWHAETGADYLIARTGRTGERGDAERLSEALGGLPLAHEQAAAYVECVEVPFAEYLRRLHAAPERLLDDPHHAPAEYHGGLTVAKALHLAIGQAAARHPAAVKLLQHAALLAPEPIPLFVLRDGRTAFGATLAGLLAGDGLDEALAALRGLALIGREAVPDERDPALRTDCFRLHRLVRQVAAAGLTEAAAAQGRAALIAALAAVYPAGVFDRPEAWPIARRLDALALPLVAAQAAIPPGAEKAASVLLDALASFRHGPLAAFAEARPLFERAVSLAETSLGDGDPLTAQTLNNLALLMRDHGDLQAAGPIHARALAVREAALGPDHPMVAVSLLNLGNVLAEQGDPAAARPLVERALAIRVAAYGENHAETALAMNNLARQLHRLGDLQTARSMLGRALAIRESCLGPHHPATGNSFKNLALLHFDLGLPDQAAAFGARALAITEAALGADHPETADIRVRLAQCMLAQGAPVHALAVAERGFAVLSSALAPGARVMRIAAAITADCLDAVGRADDAAGLRGRYLADGAAAIV